jgi:hypothetical protein
VEEAFVVLDKVFAGVTNSDESGGGIFNIEASVAKEMLDVDLGGGGGAVQLEEESGVEEVVVVFVEVFVKECVEVSVEVFVEVFVVVLGLEKVLEAGFEEKSMHTSADVKLFEFDTLALPLTFGFVGFVPFSEGFDFGDLRAGVLGLEEGGVPSGSDTWSDLALSGSNARGRTGSGEAVAFGLCFFARRECKLRGVRFLKFDIKM